MMGHSAARTSDATRSETGRRVLWHILSSA